MTDKIEKDAEMGNKEKGNPLLVIIIAFIMMAIVAGIGVYKKQSKTVADTDIIPEKQEWELCWTGIGDDTNRRCGQVKNIVFNAGGEVKDMTVFYPTGVTVEFNCAAGTIIGKWSQPSGTGWWYLEKKVPGHYVGECQGDEKGDKLRYLVLWQK